jgi:hypothetical protein|tara:strand:- start:6033 stop:6485 length:453 start_codon:yes stop_codon:yes gene_type:complete
MLLANPEVYVMSPNRNVPTRTWNPIEVIENFVSKIPETDVKFGAWTDEQEGPLSVSLRTSLAADPQNYEQVAIDMGVEMDNIAQLIGTELKNYGFKTVINRTDLEVSPGMYTSAGPNANGQRLIMYTVDGVYSLEMKGEAPLAPFSPEPV